MVRRSPRGPTESQRATEPQPLTELPVLGAPRRERADAARNRGRVLRAARRLFSEHGVENVTMEQVARAAGVGKGTVFHRFGDRSGLALALLDDGERELQEAILRGPPPLGPGAPAADRLRAFLDALLELTADGAELLIAADSGRPGARYATGAYAAWHQHIAQLVTELRPRADAALCAHLILAPLAAELVDHLERNVGVERARLRRAVGELADRLTR
ncbi:MAG: TetR family transcriptional regulator [Solirubrobacterales bacterium]|nr:TetR family transcriptional regulator [Solirubrobacterales bacterium]